MTLMPEVHDALAAAVARRAPVRRRWRSPRRGALLLAGALVVSGTAFAASTGWRPILGDEHRGHPSVAASAIPSDQLAALGVLRRAQDAGDRHRDVEAILRYLGPDMIDGVHVEGIRTLREHRDGATILVPVERVTGGPTPSSRRHRVLCVLAGVLRTTRTFEVRTAGGGSKTIPYPTGVGVRCGDLHDLRTTGIGWAAAALVPDGVARVIVRLRDHRYVSATVHDNFYEADTGGEIAPGWGARWLDAQGRTIEHRRAKVIR